MDGDEPTQATQNVLDPRREGKQNSGFSDEDISDIICVLYPHSGPARQELLSLVEKRANHIIGRDEADEVEPDYAAEDDASRFQTTTADAGNHAILLRLSSQLLDAHSGFCFGRNQSRCDVVFRHDPHKRISNIHFRIYVNEYGSVMIEDQSTNGTWVDGHLLTSNPQSKGRTESPVTRWVLSSGAVIRIYLHQQDRDLTFRVRIPHREEEYRHAYAAKVNQFFLKHRPRRQNEVVKAGPGGLDIFGNQNHVSKPKESPDVTQSPATVRPHSKRKERVSKGEWTGSGKYNKTGTIGNGAFAVVHKVTSKYDGLPYAAKEIEKRRFIKNGVLDQKVENEMKIMQRANHPHIVRYIEHFEWDERLLIIIMEYVPNGDLGKLISEDGGVLPEDVSQTMSKQLLSALGYLHDNNITHRDVKPDNILIESLDPISVKLTDFGLSKVVDTEQTFLRTFCGTLLYCAPEVYTEYTEYDDNGVRSRGKRARRVPGQRYSHAVDIWSLGGVIFYCLTASPPYPVKSGISYSELLHQIMTTRLDTSPLRDQGISDAAIDFLCRMLQRRPEYRATVKELETHAWLAASTSVVAASQSYDVITDDEEDMMVGLNDNFSQLQQHHQYDEDRVSDSMGEESEKENTPSRRGNQQPRLFGEVGVSAIGSSGVIPEDFLNIRGSSNPSLQGTEILGDYVDEAYQSDDSRAPRGGRRQQLYRQTEASMAHDQSDDQLQSLVENVASQSLGGNESAINALGVSNYSMQSMEFNTSKRKPPSHDTSDDFDENTPTGKPTMKRLKSEANMETIADEVLEEYRLLAQVPQLVRLGSGRQVDGPVNKRHFWEPDRRTWHLNYPEMTQLQLGAFLQAHSQFGFGSTFIPDASPFWKLAVKYFPPVFATESPRGGAISRATEGDDVDIPMDFPPTAVPDDGDQIPDTLVDTTQIVIPIHEHSPPGQQIATLRSSKDSCVKDIEVPVNEVLLSWGRGTENTTQYQNWMEQRVPKCALKLMLWKDGKAYDPAKAISRPPWLHDSTGDPYSYTFYVSTKASSGIFINGHMIPSSEPKSHSSPSRYWVPVRNGDVLLIWGKHDQMRTTLVFNCSWGASSRSREPADSYMPVPTELAQKLDAACLKSERRVRDIQEKRRRATEADEEQMKRAQFVERERQQSKLFEAKRQEAIGYLASLQAQVSRRTSPASATSTTTPLDRTLLARTPRVSPGK